MKEFLLIDYLKNILITFTCKIYHICHIFYILFHSSYIYNNVIKKIQIKLSNSLMSKSNLLYKKQSRIVFCLSKNK